MTKREGGREREGGGLSSLDSIVWELFLHPSQRLRSEWKQRDGSQTRTATMTRRSASPHKDTGTVAANGHKASSSDGGRGQGEEGKQKVELGKKVTLLRGVSIIIGTIIGAGIFISPKGILRNSGSVGMSLVVWIACGVLSLFGALSYAELGTCIKKSGGHYTYIMEAFGPQMAFIRLWADLIAIRPAGMAVISLAFGQYILEPLFMPCDIPPMAVKLATAIGITSVMYLNSMSVTWTARIQTVLTFSKLLAIAIIIVPGLYQLFKGETHATNTCYSKAIPVDTFSIGNTV